MASSSNSNSLIPGEQNTRNWLELPSDVTANILYRIGVVNILENAQKVCTAWCKICKDPTMWRVIRMRALPANAFPQFLKDKCKEAVDRSQGQLVDISIMGFCDDELLEYVADRSSHLRRLEILCCFDNINRSWTKVWKKFPSLEELSLWSTEISKDAVETAGRCCPMLNHLKLNQGKSFWYGPTSDEKAIAVGDNFRNLRHLGLFGNRMTNDGLKAILDGCGHLESLDLRQCLYIDLKGELGKRISQQMKWLKLPNDSFEGVPNIIIDDVYYYDDFDDPISSKDVDFCYGSDYGSD